MQTLWSRARSATNSCRCSLCNPPRTSVPRRTGGAAPTRRRHGVGDVITIFYGTVIAAALFTDAAGKIGGRVRLDRALDTVKKENEDLDRRNRERLSKLGIKWEEGEQVDVGAKLESIIDTRKSRGELDDQKVPDRPTEVPHHGFEQRDLGVISNSGELVRKDDIGKAEQEIDGPKQHRDDQRSVEAPLKIRRIPEQYDWVDVFRRRASSLGPDDRAKVEEWIAEARNETERYALHNQLTLLLRRRQNEAESKRGWKPAAAQQASLVRLVASEHTDRFVQKLVSKSLVHGPSADPPAIISTINSLQEPVLSQVTQAKNATLASLQADLDRLVEGAEVLKRQLISVLNDKSVAKDIAENTRLQRIAAVEQSLDEEAQELATTADRHARQKLRRSLHQHVKELECLHAEHLKSREPNSSTAPTKNLDHLLKLRGQLLSRLAATTDPEKWAKLKADIDADSVQIKELRLGQAQQTDAELQNMSAAERDIRTQMDDVSLLSEEITGLKAMNKDDMTGSEWKTHRHRINRRMRLLIDRRLKLQSAIDAFMAFKTSDIPTTRHPDADVSIEAWPVGQSPESVWKTQYLGKSSHYWQKRRSHEMSRTICEFIKVGLEARDDFTVDLDLDESHPLHALNLSLTNVEAEIKVQKHLILQMQSRAEDRMAALRIKDPSFPNYEMHHRDVSVAKSIGMDRSFNNALCELFANSRDSWQTLQQVCEYLATSPAPPTIQTFNILLINLPRIGLQKLNMAVFTSIIKCGLHPNEVTMEAALETASSMKQVRFFTSMADGMDAINGQGYLNLDLQTFDLVRNDPRVLTDHFWERKKIAYDTFTPEWLDSSDFAGHALTKNSKRLLRMPLSEELYEALIVGCYGIGKVKRARRLILRMEASGFKQNIRILNAALRHHLLEPPRGYIFRSLDKFLSGQYSGSPAELTETVYLYFQILRTLWRKYLEAVPRASQRSVGVLQDFELKFQELNAFGMGKGLISTPLDPRRFKPLSSQEFGILDTQMGLIKRLSKPVLHLRFDASDVQDVTVPVPQVLWLDLQPLSLREFVHERLAIVHQQYLNKHGPLPLFNDLHGHGLDGLLAVAAEHMATRQRRDRQRRRQRRNSFWIHHGQVLRRVGSRARWPTFSSRGFRFPRQSSWGRKSWRGPPLLPQATKDDPLVLENPDAAPESDHTNVSGKLSVSKVEQSRSPTTYDELRGRKYVADFSLVPGRCVARASIELR